MRAAWAFFIIIGIEFCRLKHVTMKKMFFALVFIASSYFTVSAQEAKLVSDCTVFYNVAIEDSKANPPKAIEGGTKTVYIKGNKSRIDLETSRLKQTTIYDSNSDSTIILKEAGNGKYISYLDNKRRKEINKKYEGVEFVNTNERKTILGYECQKVIGKLTDGSTYYVFYTPTIIASTSEYEYQFKNLPGFVLEYESRVGEGNTKIRYSATKITFVPVPAVKFDVPEKGYRVL